VPHISRLLRDVGKSRTLMAGKPQGLIEISKNWWETAVEFPTSRKKREIWGTRVRGRENS